MFNICQSNCTKRLLTRPLPNTTDAIASKYDRSIFRQENCYKDEGYGAGGDRHDQCYRPRRPRVLP